MYLQIEVIAYIKRIFGVWWLRMGYDCIYRKKPVGKDSKVKSNNINLYVLLPWYQKKEKAQFSLLIADLMHAFP
jgi:hypothetical protein